MALEETQSSDAAYFAPGATGSKWNCEWGPSNPTELDMPACTPALAALAALNGAAIGSDVIVSAAKHIGDCVMALRPLPLEFVTDQGLRCRSVLSMWATEPRQARKLGGLAALLGAQARAAALSSQSPLPNVEVTLQRCQGNLVRAVSMAAGWVLREHCD